MVSAWEIDEGSGGRESNLVSAAAGQEEKGEPACLADQKEETEESFLAKSPRQSRAYAALMQVGDHEGSQSRHAIHLLIGCSMMRECARVHMRKDKFIDIPLLPLFTLGAPILSFSVSAVRTLIQ